MASPAFGFTGPDRILSSKDFSRVLASPEVRLHGGPLRLRARANTMRRARLGLIVGKRVDKRAVVRNRIKRELREAFRVHKHQLPALDIVVQVVNRPARGEAGACLATLLERMAGAKT